MENKSSYCQFVAKTALLNVHYTPHDVDTNQLIDDAIREWDLSGAGNFRDFLLDYFTRNQTGGICNEQNGLSCALWCS
jgi:hypothetical protein